MGNISVRIPKRLQEGLQARALQKNIKVSQIIRDALWRAIEASETEFDHSKSKNLHNNSRQNSLEEQIYFTRCLVEHIGMIIEQGGKEFIDRCHIRKEQLLRSVR